MQKNTNLVLVVDDEIEIQRLFKQRFRKRILSKELDFIWLFWVHGDKHS